MAHPTFPNYPRIPLFRNFRQIKQKRITFIRNPVSCKCEIHQNGSVMTDVTFSLLVSECVLQSIHFPVKPLNVDSEIRHEDVS